MGIVSINLPAATSLLTTVSHAKLDLNLTSTTDDAYIALLIGRASAVVTAYIGRSVGLQTVSETFRRSPGTAVPQPPYPASYGFVAGGNMAPIILSYAQIVTISSIVEDGTTLTPVADYESEASGLLWRLSSGVRTPWAASVTVVSYSAGYILPQDSGTRSLPIEIEDVVLTLVRAAFYQRGADPYVTMDETVGVGTVQYNRSRATSPMMLDTSMMLALAPHRAVGW